jgi:hypothetical protein
LGVVFGLLTRLSSAEDEAIKMVNSATNTAAVSLNFDITNSFVDCGAPRNWELHPKQFPEGRVSRESNRRPACRRRPLHGAVTFRYLLFRFRWRRNYNLLALRALLGGLVTHFLGRAGDSLSSGTRLGRIRRLWRISLLDVVDGVRGFVELLVVSKA